MMFIWLFVTATMLEELIAPLLGRIFICQKLFHRLENFLLF